MVIICPKCKAKLKVAEEKLKPEGTTFRCPSCSALLKAKRPSPAPPPIRERGPVTDMAARQEEAAAPEAAVPPPIPEREPVTGMAARQEEAAPETVASQPEPERGAETTATAPESATSAPGPAGVSASAPSPRVVADERVERARRLARTVLSDIELYSPEKVAAAVKDNNFESAFAGELEEGLKLYKKRITEEVRNMGDFFREEMDNYLRNKKKTLGLQE